jgi:F-type H+-transporting ATPase subunit a
MNGWENIVFSAIVAALILLISWLGTRKKAMIPSRLQAAVEIVVGGLDDFICGVMGPRGRRFVPFIGTLFIYILSMNLFGLIPFMKSATSSWSVTLGLALCVFVYLEYTAFKELGFFGYMDMLMERPRGFLAFSVFIPLLMLFIHVVTELVKPLTLSLRLRSNVWGDDMLLAVLANFGIGGVPLLLFSTFLTIIAAVVQALVFCLLTTIYFSLIILEKEE